MAGPLVEVGSFAFLRLWFWEELLYQLVFFGHFVYRIIQIRSGWKVLSG